MPVAVPGSRKGGRAWLPLFTSVFSLALALSSFTVPGANGERSQSNQERPLAPTLSLEGQRLSSAGQAELRAIIEAGELPALHRPRFEDLQGGVTAFYAAIQYSLAWIRSSQPTSQATAVIELLKSADRKGLDPEDYEGPRWSELELSLGFMSSDADLVRFDVALTTSVMRYISDLNCGRVRARLTQCEIDIENTKLDLSNFLLLKVLNTAGIETLIAQLEPPYPTYRRTLHALQDYLVLAKSYEGIPLPVPSEPVRPGDPYAGVPRLTRLLTLLGDLSGKGEPGISTQLYQEPLVQGVKRFQQRHGLEPNGQIDSETLKALNTPLERRIRQLQLTLERWRWLPHNLQLPAIIVNIPEFRLRVVDENYHWVVSMKIVVGMAYSHETPVFTSELRSVTFRPSWSVPLGIQRNELLPQIEKDPSYLSANSYVVTDSSGRVVAGDLAENEILERLRSGEWHLRQEPGPNNALDLIRFDLPDPFDIYLHGTPATELFARTRRDFSHGCIRVEDPLALASWIFRNNPEWTPERMRIVMSGEKTIRVSLERPIPVLIVYGTAVVMEDGQVYFLDDIYGQDAALEDGLGKRHSSQL